MMETLIVAIVVACLGGIIVLNAKTPGDKTTREQFLEELRAFLQGALEPIESDIGTNSFRIKFQYKGQDFVYEDLEKKGFKGKDFKGYLKTKVPNKLTLTFTEAKRSTKIRSDIFLASEISSHYASDHIDLIVPKFLQGLKIFTNDPGLTNEIFGDNKLSGVFKKYKNVDNRGYAFVSIGLVRGEIILEFRSVGTCYPNVYDLRGNIHSIDDHLERMMLLVAKLSIGFH